MTHFVLKNIQVVINNNIKSNLFNLSTGDTERLVQGVFHNYPEVCPDKINWIVKSLDWLQFYDVITKAVMSQQAWILMPYSLYAVVDCHFHLSTTMYPKLSYPLAMIEVNLVISLKINFL